jgi:GNAT superfamily N-acetyltransferase
MNRPPIELRKARPDDLERLSALIAHSYSTLYADWYPPEVLAAALPKISDANPRLLESDTYFVAEEDGEPIGCGGWSMEAPGNRENAARTGHIRHVAVHPDHLRKGVGRMIMQRVFETATAAGIERLECLSSLQAEAFYAKLGFRKKGTVDIPFGAVTFASIDMERPLN